MPKVRAPDVVQQELIDRVLAGPGVTTPAQRAAASRSKSGGDAAGGSEGLPVEAVAFLEKVRAHAYKVTNEDIATLKAAGLDEESIFELTIAAAVGVSKRRLEAAMKAIHEAG